ncbi:hypothetical protein Tco_0644102, partial [Tanacetum coccineum]
MINVVASIPFEEKPVELKEAVESPR